MLLFDELLNYYYFVQHQLPVHPSLLFCFYLRLPLKNRFNLASGFLTPVKDFEDISSMILLLRDGGLPGMAKFLTVTIVLLLAVTIIMIIRRRPCGRLLNLDRIHPMQPPKNNNIFMVEVDRYSVFPSSA